MISCGEVIDKGPFVYTGEVLGTKHVPRKTTMSYSASQKRMVTRTISEKNYVYYDFFGEDRIVNSKRIFENCTDSLDIIYYNKYVVKKEVDTSFLKVVISEIKIK